MPIFYLNFTELLKITTRTKYLNFILNNIQTTFCTINSIEEITMVASIIIIINLSKEKKKIINFLEN